MAQPEAAEQWLTVDQAADVMQISRWKVYDLIRSGLLESVSLGRARRIPLDAITRLRAERAA